MNDTTTTIDVSNLGFEGFPVLDSHFVKDEFVKYKLTDEEHAEKAELEVLFEAAKKERMKAVFMDANSSLRERIVDGIMYERLKIKLSFIQDDQSGASERLKELRRSSIRLNVGHDRVVINNHSDYMYDLNISHYFNEDEVIEMHKDATIMEMINE